jgi:hypothetical protein
VLMGQRRITAASAVASLRTTSQNRNIKLQALAAAIVEGAGGQPPQPPPFDPLPFDRPSLDRPSFGRPCPSPRRGPADARCQGDP